MPNPMDAMCWVSPADEKGNVDNLLSRVARLEEIIAQLVGANINAIQLSDITPRAGVVTDFTAIASNAAGGWITDGTFTGVGISTLGWKMSDGNTFPIVQMVDGALVYGFDREGGVSGSGTIANSGRLIGAAYSNSVSVTASWVNVPMPNQIFNGGTFVFPRQGHYLICYHVHSNSAAAPGSDSNIYARLTTNGGAGDLIFGESFPSGVSTAERVSGGAQVQAGPAGTTIGIEVTGTLSTTVDCSLSILQLGTV